MPQGERRGWGPLGYDPVRGARELLDVRVLQTVGVLTLFFLLVTPKGLQRRAW